MNQKAIDEKKPIKAEPWGILSCIDLYDCKPETIRDAKKIKRFVAQLSDLLEMETLWRNPE